LERVALLLVVVEATLGVFRLLRLLLQRASADLRLRGRVHRVTSGLCCCRVRVAQFLGGALACVARRAFQSLICFLQSVESVSGAPFVRVRANGRT
jgi:hypothetical protein